MKTYQIKELSTPDLLNTLKEQYEALDNYTFQHASGQLENYKAMRNTKKDIARILTIINEREAKEKNQQKKD
jgi:large subunit ribosomal protein L29